MFRDARDVDDGDVLTASVCIAGAGAAGITMARDLIASGRDVIVLESGGLEGDEDTQALYEGPQEGHVFRGLGECRLRYFGGTTNHWAGWCRPLEDDVLTERPGVAPPWPISHADLFPYYRRANETCGIGAYEFSSEPVAERAGRTLLDLDPERVVQPLYQFSLPPRRFGEAYREELEEAADVAVYLHANLVDIRLTDDGGRVRAFVCKTLGGARFEIEADHYALALGGIENARLLLASRGQEPAGVGNQSGLVGRYFMEHPHLYSGAAVLLPDDVDVSFYLGHQSVVTIDDDHPDGLNTTAMPSLAVAPQLRAREGLLPFACQIFNTEPDHFPATEALLALPDVRALIRRGGEREGRLFGITMRAEQRPLEDSRVFLADDEDALGLPRAGLDWRIDDRDRADFRRGMEIVGAELARAGLGRLWLRLDDDGLFPQGEIRGGCHHMGTTAMSSDPERGVVDAECRVHGLDNLYVAGSSVFPSGGYANPTLAIVALAHRLAERLAEVAA